MASEGLKHSFTAMGMVTYMVYSVNISLPPMIIGIFATC